MGKLPSYNRIKNDNHKCFFSSAATLADITCAMYNKSLPFDLNDRTSFGFVRQQGKFCEDVSIINALLGYVLKEPF